MGKYTEDSKELLEFVGGKENIAAVSHCMTRMRFVLADPKKADVKKIESMKVVKGSFTQAGQFQVIIGNTVAEFYKDFTAVAGIEGVSKDAVKAAAGANQNILQRAAAIAAEIFAPLIPAIITGGLILVETVSISSIFSTMEQKLSSNSVNSGQAWIIFSGLSVKQFFTSEYQLESAGQLSERWGELQFLESSSV